MRYFILLTLVTLSLCGTVLADTAGDRPNFLLIVSEDNGPDLGCYGNEFVSTPRLDQLAKEGVRFDRAYVPCAGCSQSRAAYLTGLYPHQNGQFGLATWQFHMYDPETPNIVSQLHASGYKTGLLGKLHVNPESAFPFDMRWGSANFERKHLGQYASCAGAFMRDAEQPFFLSVNYPDPHRPFIRQVDGMPEAPLSAEDIDVPEAIGIETPTLRQEVADYYNCMSRLDQLVGDLLDALDRSGKRANTWIIYLGDHGYDLLRGKRTSYETGVRVPLIIQTPSSARGEVRCELTSTLDLAPTLLEAAGLESKLPLPGRSLAALLRGERVLNWRKYLFTEFVTHSAHNYFPQRTVRDDRYKLIETLLPGEADPGYSFTLSRFYDPGKIEQAIAGAPRSVAHSYLQMHRPARYQLFDLRDDPHEWHDLSEDPGHKQTLDRLANELTRWRRETEDPFLDPEFTRLVQEEIKATRTRDGGHRDPDHWNFYDTLAARARGLQQSSKIQPE